MKKMRSILAFLMVLVLLAAPAGALAEGKTVTFTLTNPTIEIGEEIHSVDMTVSLSSGLDLSEERAFLTLNALSGANNALTALGALENGTITAYVNGMKQYISMPFNLEDVLSQLEEEIKFYVDDELADFEAFTSAFENMPEVTIDEEAVAELLETVESYYTGEEDVELDDGAFIVTCDVYQGSLTLEEVIALVDLLDRCASGYFSQAFMTGFEAGMDMDDMSDMTLEDVLAAVQESEVDVVFDFYNYYSEDGLLSFYVEAQVAEGEKIDTIGLEIEIGSYDPEWLYGYITVTGDVDDEEVEFSIYADNFFEGDSETKRLMVDVLSEEGSFSVNLSNDLYPEYNATYLTFSVNEGETADITLGYTIFPDAANPANHYGTFNLLLSAEGMEESLFVSVDTALTVSDIPEGELLTISGLPAVDPTTASGDTMEAFGEELGGILEDAMLQLIAAPGAVDLLEALSNLA